MDDASFFRVFCEEFCRRRLGHADLVPEGLYEAAIEAVGGCLGYSPISPKAERLARVGRGALSSKDHDNSAHYRFLEGWVTKLRQEAAAKQTALSILLDSPIERSGAWQIVARDEPPPTFLAGLANTLQDYFHRSAPLEVIGAALQRKTVNGAVAALALAFGVDTELNYGAVRQALSLTSDNGRD